jgi:hypothetical protein
MRHGTDIPTPHVLRNRADVRAIRGVHVPDMTTAAKRDAERLLREVPPDTRDLTSRICGDPVKGRRAIDRRQA